MRLLMASATLCAFLSPPPAAAQSDAAGSDDINVYRNDLPETHDGIDLSETGDAASELPADLRPAYATAEASALAVQQYGNVASVKYADGAVRDLGDRMILLGRAIIDRLDAGGGDDDQQDSALLSAYVRADLEVLKTLNGEQFDAGVVGNSAISRDQVATAGAGLAAQFLRPSPAGRSRSRHSCSRWLLRRQSRSDCRGLEQKAGRARL